jgi:hypothetical protein
MFLQKRLSGYSYGEVGDVFEQNVIGEQRALIFGNFHK